VAGPAVFHRRYGTEVIGILVFWVPLEKQETDSPPNSLPLPILALTRGKLSHTIHAASLRVLVRKFAKHVSDQV
jgi:hypothetical protein